MLAVRGVGADVDETTWRSVFRQLVALGLARVDHGSYGALQLTEAARPVLRGEQTLFTRADEVDRLWQVCEPVLQSPPQVQPYEPGSWGPEAALAMPPGGWQLRG